MSLQIVVELVLAWRVVPRCHLREAGIGTFAAGLVLAAFGLGMYEESVSTVLLAVAALMGAAALALFWPSHRREPRPWRTDDVKHYERRASEWPKGTT